MGKKIIFGTTMGLALLVACTVVSRTQELSEAPNAHDSPEVPEIFVLSGGQPNLGITLGEVTPEKAQELKLSAVAGAIVTSVKEGSAAAKAGLQNGDVIVAFDGAPVRSSAELRRLVRETPAGRSVAIKVMRNGQTHILNATMDAPADSHFSINMPDVHIPSMDFPEFQFPFFPSRTSLGISGDDLTVQLAQYFGVKQGKGVLVREVIVGSAAEKAGLKAGDVVVQVGENKVGGVEELRAQLNDHSTGETRKVKLTIVRDRHEQTVDVELTPSAPGQRHMATAGLMGIDRAKLAEYQAQIHAATAEIQRQVQMQRESMQGEWQRQLHEQLRELHEQLKNHPALQVMQISKASI